MPTAGGSVEAAQIVREAVRAYNGDFRTRRTIAIEMGIVTSLGVFAIICVGCFVVMSTTSIRTLWIALAIFGLLYVVAWCTAAPGITPDRSGELFNEEDLDARARIHRDGDIYQSEVVGAGFDGGVNAWAAGDYGRTCNVSEHATIKRRGDERGG